MRKFLLLILFCFLNTIINAQNINIATIGVPYNQDFDSLTSTLGTGQAYTNGVTLHGWHLFKQPAPGVALATYGGDNGAKHTGQFYSFGLTTERAFGAVGSGGAYYGNPAVSNPAGWMAVSFTNITGSTINDITIGFDGEQWRDANVSAQPMVLEYGFGAAFTSVVWTAPGGAFDWSSVVNTGANAAVNGNVAGLVPGVGGVLTSAGWANGTTLWIRWIVMNAPGTDHGLAIDNFVFNTANGCTAPTLSELHTNVLCNGDSTGAINLTCTGGTSPFTYSWSGPGGFTDISEDISNVPAGTYTVTVTATGGCTTSTTAVVSEPAALSLTTTNTNADCNGASNGSIDLTVSGGVPTYIFDWSNGAVTEDISSLIAGTYSIILTDDNGCTITDSVIISQPGSLLLSSLNSNPTCSAVSNGSIDLIVSGGTPGYAYLWSNSATTQDLGGLPNGSYSVLVTDTNGCTAFVTINLNSPVNLSLSAIWTNAYCNGGSDASIDLTVNSGLPLFSYAWSNSASTQDLSGITAGTYSVVVTDAIGCTGSLSLMIGEAGLINSSISVSACDFYVSPSGLYTYTSTGLYADTIPAANGCDSLIGISVTIFNTNVSVTTFGQIFQADQLGAQYQWVDCNNSFAPIGGATFPNYFSGVNGDFAVIITENGCTDTSACYSTGNLGLDNNLNDAVSLYPNPNDGVFNLSIDGIDATNVSFDILDISGKVVHSRVLDELSSATIVGFSLTDLEPGIYFIRFKMYNEVTSLKFVKM